MASKKNTNKKAAVSKSGGKKSMKKKTAAKKTAARSNSIAVSAKPRTKAVRKAKKKPSLIGIDPLAWIDNAETKIDDTLAESTQQDCVAEAEPTQQDSAEEQPAPPGNITSLSFSPRFSIREVAARTRELQQLLEQDAQVELDFEDVDIVDTAAIQLLVAFTKEAHKRGVAISWQQPSAALLRSAELLGLSQELGLPDVNI